MFFSKNTKGSDNVAIYAVFTMLFSFHPTHQSMLLNLELPGGRHVNNVLNAPPPKKKERDKKRYQDNIHKIMVTKPC